MPRVLLIISLSVAQLVSWSASPLFLCFDDDGDLSIDLGPGACQCERHSHQTPERQAGSIQGERIASNCDCAHVPLTVAWTAVTVNSKESRPATLSHTPALLTNLDGSGCLPPACEVSRSHRPLAHGHESRARTPVLRC